LRSHRTAEVLGQQMKIERKFTKVGQDAYSELEFVSVTSEIRNPDGTIVFRQEDIEVPAGWSQVASDVIAQKYFRKAGVPVRLKKLREKNVPEFLWRSVADGDDSFGHGARHAFGHGYASASKGRNGVTTGLGPGEDQDFGPRAAFDQGSTGVAVQQPRKHAPTAAPGG